MAVAGIADVHLSLPTFWFTSAVLAGRGADVEQTGEGLLCSEVRLTVSLSPPVRQNTVWSAASLHLLSLVRWPQPTRTGFFNGPTTPTECSAPSGCLHVSYTTHTHRHTDTETEYFQVVYRAAYMCCTCARTFSRGYTLHTHSAL